MSFQARTESVKPPDDPTASPALAGLIGQVNAGPDLAARVGRHVPRQGGDLLRPEPMGAINLYFSLAQGMAHADGEL